MTITTACSTRDAAHPCSRARPTTTDDATDDDDAVDDDDDARATIVPPRPRARSIATSHR